MFKKIAIVLVVLILLAGGGIYYLFANMDGLIRSAIENYGSQATQCAVKLESVALKLQTGEGKLAGLSIANPKGFSSSQAFYLGAIDVQVDTNSLRGNGPIVISHVNIDKPQVSYELPNSGDSNLQTIQKNTETYANKFKSPDGKQPTNEQAKQEGQGRKIIIKSLTISNGQVNISQEMLQGKQLGTGLPTLHLTNIGEASGGATAAQVAEQVINAISGAAMQASVTELAKQKLNGLIDAVPTGAIGKGGVDAVGSKLKGLLGN